MFKSYVFLNLSSLYIRRIANPSEFCDHECSDTGFAAHLHDMRMYQNFQCNGDH